MIDFTDDIKIGVEHLDIQHKELIQFFNRAYLLCETKPSKDTMDAELYFLGRYIITHLQGEELLQLETNYPDYQNHRWKHEAFFNNFSALKLAWGNGDMTIDELMLALARTLDWVVDHIKEEGVAFGEYYNQLKGVK
jgi:hemerythrin